MALNNYTVTINNSKFALKLSDKYESIKGVLGLKTITGDIEEAGPVVKPRELLAQGKAVRLRITYKISATSKKRRSAMIYCPVDKTTTAPGALLGKTWGGTANVITSTNFPSNTTLT